MTVTCPKKRYCSLVSGKYHAISAQGERARSSTLRLLGEGGGWKKKHCQEYVSIQICHACFYFFFLSLVCNEIIWRVGAYRASVTNVRQSVSHKKPRKTTVRLDGLPSGLRVAIWKYLECRNLSFMRSEFCKSCFHGADM